MWQAVGNLDLFKFVNISDRQKRKRCSSNEPMSVEPVQVEAEMLSLQGYAFLFIK